MTSVTQTDNAAATPSRRERLREELTAEIKRVARVQLAEKGAGGISWRGIAREVGMSPAALYTYFESLDDLYTALITDSFNSLSTWVEASIDVFADGPVGDRLTAGIAGYREWSLRHAEEFRLIFQNVIPGYEAPENSQTVAANLKSSAQFLALVVEGWATGELTEPSPGPFVDPSGMNEKFGMELTSDQMRVSLASWSTFHGAVQLEVNDHIDSDWVDNDRLFTAVVDQLSFMCGCGSADPGVHDRVRTMLEERWPGRPRRTSQ